MYTNVLEHRFKSSSRDRVLGNLHQQETEEIVVYTHGIAMKAAFAGPKKPQDEDQKPIKMRNRRASLSPPRYNYTKKPL